MNHRTPQRTPRRRTPNRSLRSRIALGFLAVSTVVLSAGLGGCAGGGRAVEPMTSPAQLDFGVDMARRGLWSEALFRFRQAERLNPGDAKILNNMAVAYEALGQFEKALEHYQDAVKAAPSDEDVRRNYSRFVEFYRAFRPNQQADARLENDDSSDG